MSTSKLNRIRSYLKLAANKVYKSTDHFEDLLIIQSKKRAVFLSCIKIEFIRSFENR